MGPRLPAHAAQAVHQLGLPANMGLPAQRELSAHAACRVPLLAPALSVDPGIAVSQSTLHARALPIECLRMRDAGRMPGSLRRLPGQCRSRTRGGARRSPDHASALFRRGSTDGKSGRADRTYTGCHLFHGCDAAVSAERTPALPDAGWAYAVLQLAGAVPSDGSAAMPSDSAGTLPFAGLALHSGLSADAASRLPDTAAALPDRPDAVLYADARVSSDIAAALSANPACALSDAAPALPDGSDAMLHARARVSSDIPAAMCADAACALPDAAAALPDGADRLLFVPAGVSADAGVPVTGCAARCSAMAAAD